MIVRVFNTLRFFSILFLLVVLMYVYANLSDVIGLESDESGKPVGLVSKNVFFYGTLFFLTLTNGIFLLLIRLYNRVRSLNEKYKQALLIWLNGLMGTLNFFFALALIFISAFNSLEKLDLENFGITVLASGGLVITWILGFSYVLMQRGK